MGAIAVGVVLVIAAAALMVGALVRFEGQEDDYRAACMNHPTTKKFLEVNKGSTAHYERVAIGAGMECYVVFADKTSLTIR